MCTYTVKETFVKVEILNGKFYPQVQKVSPK